METTMTRPMTNIEHQIESIRKIHAEAQPCPRCGEGISAWRAADNGRGFNPANYDGYNDPKNYRCPKCNARLNLQVPFIGPTYQWELINPKWYRQSKEDGTI